MLLCQEAQVGENGMLSLSMKCDRASSPADCRAMKHASLAKKFSSGAMHAQLECEV